MAHSEYRHFLRRAEERVEAVVLPAEIMTTLGASLIK
jgi:hypothetical protein